MRKDFGTPVTVLTIAMIVMLAVVALPVSAGTPDAISATGDITEVRLSVDVTGDGQADVVELIAQPYEPGSVYARSRVVKLIDGATARISILDLGEAGAGYEGRLWTTNIDESNIPAIFVTVNTGGSGGIIVPFVLTASGDGSLRHVPTRGQLASTPEVNWEPRDHYQIGYEHDFGSGMLGLPDEQPFEDVYSSEGKLVSQFQVYIDNVGVIETPVPAQGTKSDIITYRQAWAIFHANTIGIIRTTWRWNGLQLVPVNVEVLPLSST